MLKVRILCFDGGGYSHELRFWRWQCCAFFESGRAIGHQGNRANRGTQAGPGKFQHERGNRQRRRQRRQQRHRSPRLASSCDEKCPASGTESRIGSSRYRCFAPRFVPLLVLQWHCRIWFRRTTICSVFSEARCKVDYFSSDQAGPVQTSSRCHQSPVVRRSLASVKRYW